MHMRIAHAAATTMASMSVGPVQKMRRRKCIMHGIQIVIIFRNELDKVSFMCKWMEEIDGMIGCDIANKPCLTMEQGMV